MTESNQVFSCGWNHAYALGDNTQKNRHVPVLVYGVNDVNYLQNAIEISAGWEHSLALSADSNHRVLAFGYNTYGELGDGTYTPRSAPVYVRAGEMNSPSGFLEHINCISAGRSGTHSLCADACGLCWSFGNNVCGQLGNDDASNNQDLPVRVHAGEQDPCEPNTNQLRNIIEVSAGTDHSMALEKLDVNDPNDPNDICDPNCKGRVYTFGKNDHGKLGINKTEGQQDKSTIPVKVHSVNVNDDFNGLQNIVAISAGWYHSMALEKIDPNDPNCKGRVYTWGFNGASMYGIYGGRLGNGTTIDSAVPVVVLAGEQDPNHPNAPLQNIIAISAGEGHSMALDANGFIYTWGDNYYGQLGNGTNDPCAVPVRAVGPDDEGFLSDINHISAGYWHNLAVDQSGQTYVWGRGTCGRLGIGSTGNVNIPVPLYIYEPNVYNQTQNNKRYKSIEPAINEANDYDVIVVYEGYYSEGIDFGGKAITLRSADPNNQSVVNNTRIYATGYGNLTGDGETLNQIIKVANNLGSEISGFTITCGVHGIYCSDSNLTINRCRIKYNGHCGIRCINCTQVTITNTSINNNNSTSYTENYGGIYASGGANIIVDRCDIADNGCNGIKASNGSVSIKNSIIHRNNSGGYDEAGMGGIYLSSVVSADVRRSTIVDNCGYGIYRGGGNDPNINSNIIYGNDYNLCDSNRYGDSFNKVNYNCIEGNYPGTDNIDIDPCFVDANNNNYHLKMGSNCIERGDPNFNGANETDIDGEDRVIDGDSNGTATVDIGADEFYYCSGRIDIAPNPPDGIVNFLDFAVLAEAWMTGAGDDDYNDVVDFADDGAIDYKDLDKFCDCWLYATGEYLDNHQQSFGGEGAYFEQGFDQGGEYLENPADSNEIIPESQEDQSDSNEAMTESEENEPPAMYLVCDTNMPDPNDEVTVWIHTDVPLFCMGLIITVTGDANITDAMSTADCNSYGWDPDWPTDPEIDPAGWVCVSGVKWDGDANGVVGYFKFRYNSGRVTASITECESFDPNCQGVSFSPEVLSFGPDPNE